MKKREPGPPVIFVRIFRWFCNPRLVDHIEGDLLEVYAKRKRNRGKLIADLRFMVDVLFLFRKGIVKPIKVFQKLNSSGMYRSYFKIGFRNLLKNKGYSLINIGGLAIGMAVAMLIGLWIHDELNYNTYFRDYNRIARVMRMMKMNGEVLTTAVLPSALGEELRTKYGHHFEQVTMVAGNGNHIISVSSANGKAGESKLSMHGQFIEANGPAMFSLKILYGTTSALSDPHSIIISESASKDLFGTENAMGKILTIDKDDRMEVKVTGIYEDFPHSTDFRGVKFFAPYELFLSLNNWAASSFTNDFLSIFVTIDKHDSFESVSANIKDAILNNVRGNDGYVAVNPQITLHPMSDWRLRTEWRNGVNTGGLIQIIRMFGIVGAFVLLLACINFMNLSTARSEKRAKEVGIRKAIGSARVQLMGQFFSESFLVVGFAFLVALFAVSSVLPSFNAFGGKQIVMPWGNGYFWLNSFIFILVTGLLAGSYPALYLSSFNAVRVLKGTLRVGRLASLPRKVLVVTQFTVSVTLIIGTTMIYKQIQFAKDRPVGYNRDGLLMLYMSLPEFHGKHEILLTELKNTGAVIDVAESSSPTTEVWTENAGFDWVGKDPAFTPQMATITVTPEYGKTVGWEFINGRDFSRDIASDSAGFIINEAAAKLLGFENPVGQTLKWQGGWRSKHNSFTVLGVTKNMVMKSPYALPTPSVYFLSSTGTNFINIRMNPQISTSDALQKIERVFKNIIPTAAFDYRFADEEYALKFQTEERVGKLASIFTLLAILISCLGLFGLASFVAEQRTKEIGIRKVVGASVFNLWKMLSKDFVVLIIIACMIAVPLSYYFLSTWLQKYEYRTEMSWWVFVVITVSALMITLLTVSYQAVKAALLNPVKSLRSE